MQTFADSLGVPDDDGANDYLWHDPLVAFNAAASGPTEQLQILLPGVVRGRMQIGVLLVPHPGSGLSRLARPLGLTEVNLAQELLASLSPTASFAGLTSASDLLQLIDGTSTHPRSADGLLLTGLDLLLTRLPPAECALAWTHLLEGPPHRRLVLALASSFAAYGPADFARWQQAQRGAIWQG